MHKRFPIHRLQYLVSIPREWRIKATTNNTSTSSTISYVKQQLLEFSCYLLEPQNTFVFVNCDIDYIPTSTTNGNNNHNKENDENNGKTENGNGQDICESFPLFTGKELNQNLIAVIESELEESTKNDENGVLIKEDVLRVGRGLRSLNRFEHRTVADKCVFRTLVCCLVILLYCVAKVAP